MKLTNRQTRKQIIMDKRNEIIRGLFADGFLLEEIAMMFRIRNTRVSQIVKKYDKNI